MLKLLGKSRTEAVKLGTILVEILFWTATATILTSGFLALYKAVPMIVEGL